MSSEAKKQPTNLYEKLAMMAGDPTQDHPVEAIRKELLEYAKLLAPVVDEDPAEWSVYVEKHIAGIRFILRDTAAKEINLQRLPVDPKELVEWLS